MTNQTESSTTLKLIRGSLDSLSVYDITDYELDILEEGSPNSIFLNFAVFFASISISFFITLVTVEITSTPIFTVFVVFTVVGAAATLVLFTLWWKTHSKVSELIQRIRDRAISSQEKSDKSDTIVQTPITGETESRG